MDLVRKWKEFESQVVDPKASPIQKAEVRLAFFSGMFAALGLLDLATSPTKLHEQARRLYQQLASQMEDEYKRLEARRGERDL
jgi:hypothetical protein